MEVLLQVLLWCPRCWKSIGLFVFTACGASALLGLRLISGADRIERKSGVVVDFAKAFESLPLPIPTTPEGVALAVVGAILGAGMVLVGKWAQKYE